MFLYYNHDQYIAFLKRSIPQSYYYDCTSVYGYPGPASNVSFNKLSDQTIENFKRSFAEFLYQDKIVSVFSRLHPFIGQYRLLKKCGGKINTAKCVVIDLSLSDQARQRAYRRSTRQRISQLRKMGIRIKEADIQDEIIAFARIYTENMVRVNAASYYFLTKIIFSVC